jgi:multidrug efflux pump subunit AcrB
MRLTEFSLHNPPAIAAAAVIVLLFGTLALLRLPVQLLPDTAQPRLFVGVGWREAAPSEVEETLVEPVENVLRGLPGLAEMRSNSGRGGGGVELAFELGTDMTRAMLDVVNRLNGLPPLPADATQPRVNAGQNWQGETAASMLIQRLPGNPDVGDMIMYQRVMEEVLQPRIAQVPGVASVELSGRPREVHVRFDPHRLAALGLAPAELAQAVSGARDSSAGFVNIGRRQFTVRFTGQEPIEELGSLIVAWSGDRPLYLRDVADIDIGYQERNWFSLRSGNPGYYVRVARANDANTVAVLDGVRSAIEELNAGPLREHGLFAEMSWDASVYIKRAISFVRDSLALGIGLVVIGLWYFLRGPRALLVIGLSIPMSLFFAVITLELLGRSLNVISLAGLAFSTGIVIDAALIVQGNIIRYFQQGASRERATVEGAQEVIPALFAAMLTSIAIFLPVLFMEGLEGQLFSDLAITMSVSHAASLLVAMTLIPAANRWALARSMPVDQHQRWWSGMAAAGMRLTDSSRLRQAWIAGLVGGSLVFSWALLPRIDYLPRVQTDLIWTNFTMPAGGSLPTVEHEIAQTVVARARPYLEGEKSPGIHGYNLSSWNGQFGVMVTYPEDPRAVAELMDVLRDEIWADLPDVRPFVSQGSLLNVDGNNAREIRIDFQGADVAGLMEAARVAVDAIPAAIPGTFPRPWPALEINQPEIRLQPDEWRIARAGLTRSQLAGTVRAYTGGLYAGEYFDGNERLDVIVKGNGWRTPEALAELPVVSPGGGVLTLGELARVSQTVGPTQLARINGRRTVSVGFEPPQNMTLDEALEILREVVEPQLREVLPKDASLRYAGSANELAQTLRTMSGNFLLALLILFALMAALFRSLRDSLIVMLVIPVAMAGGIAALRAMALVRGFQSLDLLTMIGFIVLLGLVVNAAILLVDQTRARERAGVARREAVAQALESRARPIVLSTLTAVLGMLPLILAPGLGAEIYRGLATVVAGGMLVGTLFTWVLMPSLLRLGEAREVPLHGEALTQ